MTQIIKQEDITSDITNKIIIGNCIDVMKCIESNSIDMVFANPKNTSQNCISCGNLVQKGLSARMHSCPFCGLELDRDHNAAINILNRSKNTVGTTEINACQGTQCSINAAGSSQPFRGSSSW